jgi:GNAT superfamily N-acetyltransferase
VQPRRLRPDDLDQVRQVLRDSYADHVRVEPSYLDELTDLERRDREAEVWVVDGVVDGESRAVGTVTICPTGSPYREIARDGELEFRMLAVSPAAQGQGAGRALSELVVEEARRRGYAAVALSTTPTMTTAHRLYESQGYVRDPDRDWSPHPGVDLRVYRLELT